MEEKVEKTYDSSAIQVLEGLEAVRKRPGMYIGTTDVKGLHHLVWEIVDNSIDEALAGYCKNIEVVINKDNSITVKDDGRGIPVEIHPKTGKSTVETVYTVLHAGGKFGGGGYKVSGGLHGVGASVVNALSKWVEVKVYKDGKINYIRFENGGHTVEPLKVIGECEPNRTGTYVTFKPDPEIFDTDIYDYNTLMVRIRELAFLNRGLRLTLRDDRDEEDTTGETFMYEGGISEYVRFINQGKTPIHEDIIHLEGEENDVMFEVAMQYNTGYADNIYSFVNNINTHDGGTHEEGVRRALTRVINSYARKSGILKEKDESLTGDDVKEGLTMIVSCKHPNPQFEGQTKGRLGNSEVRKLADNVFAEGFQKFLLENPDEAKIIVEKAMLACRARNAAKKAREITRKSDLRYDKIIIMTDADVDGSHIRVLLLTLFYRFFRPIVEAGHIYAAQPPLFRIMHGKTRKYVLNEEEKEKYLMSLPENVRSKAEIARMKGLGEMDAEELNETTMDIEKRTLRKITVDDCMEADAMFSKLMGEEVEPRRKFIEDNAIYVKNLDI